MEEFIAPISTLQNLDIEYDDFNNYLANINTVLNTLVNSTILFY